MWGYSDSTKKIVIEPQWEFTTPFQGNTAVVKLNGKFGLVDKSGKTTTGYIYSQLDEESRYGRRVASVGKGKRRFGLIDEKGREIIPFKYSTIYWESDRYLRVEDGMVYGEIDSSGRIIIPFEYATTHRDQVDMWNDNVENGFFIFSLGSGYKFGVVDTNNKIIVPFIYDQMNGMHGYFWAFKEGKKGMSVDSEFVFDRNGMISDWSKVPRMIWYPNIYVPSYHHDSTGYYFSGWTDTSGNYNMVHEKRCLYAGRYRQGLAPFMNTDSLCGFVNLEFEESIPPKYGWCSEFSENSLALVYYANHHYPKKFRYKGSYTPDRYDVANRQPIGYIDIHGTEYWED